MKKTFGFPILFMAIVTAFFTFILAFLNYSTAEKIQFNEQTELRKKILYVFDIETESQDPEEVEKVFNEKIEEEKIDGETIYIMKSQDEVLGYAFPVRGAGLWGSILGYVGVSSDYSEIIGIDFISHSETPGLGGRIEEEFYKEQFRGLDLTNGENGEYIVYKPSPRGNVDAISGATLTSKSVSNFLNEDIENFIKARREE